MKEERRAELDMDFDAFYRGERTFRLGGEQFAFDDIPWDTGGPEPLVAELERTGGVRGRVLDAGCGLGRNAIFLAGRGYSVTGFDGSPTAIERARERARAQNVSVELMVSDATTLDGLQGRTFNTVVDSGLYHCLDESQRERYVAALGRVCGPGARVHLLGFSAVAGGIASEVDAPVVGEEELRRRFADGWTIRALEPAFISTTLTREAVESRGLPFDTGNLRFDDEGRLRLPVWRLDAERV